jgi:DNA polymerase I-like protein with 3'-5' exonuclease and polymerase domains
MIALDTETTWTKDRGIGTHGVHAYVRHPETECFLVSLFDADTGLSFVGDPKDAPWEQLRGQNICCHNYSFDSAVLRELERRKVIPFPLEEKGFCTANLVAYLQAPRSLLGSSAELLGIGLDKTNRDKFKGKDYRTLPQTVKWEIAEYALKDAKACWLLWKKFGHLMPDVERRLSAHTTLMGDRGIALDIDGVEAGIRHYKEILWGLEKLIPWAKTAPIMSLPQMRAACVKAGIPAPESTAKNDESFQVWADQYAVRVPFVAALSKYRSVNRALSVLEAMRIRHVDDRLRYGLKYYGAVPTGRWAGDSGLNMQNFTRDAVEGVDIRQMLVAAPGKKFVSADLSQIEPRVSLLITGDHKQLDLVRNGMCVYEAHARQTLGYDLPIPMKDAAKKDDAIAKMRQFAKARCLSADTLVLTDSGYKPIVDVHTSDLLWDGVEWVRHDGLVFQGSKPTHEIHGDRFTDDHELFTGDQTTITAGQAVRESALPVARYRESASSWNDVWQLARLVVGMAAQRWVQALALPLRTLRQAGGGDAPESHSRSDKKLPPVRAGSASRHPQYPQVGQG